MKQKKRLFLLLLLVLVCLVLLITGTYAAYTNTAYVKRVVTTGIDTNAVPFSSNYLYEHSSGTYIRHIITVPKNGSTPVDIAICNYPFKDSTRFNDKQISYTLAFSVVDKNGNTPNDPPSTSDFPAGSFTLQGGQISINTHTITFTHEQVSTFKDCLIRITAASNGGLDTPTVLAAEFELITASGMTSEWRGHFTDAESPAQLDAFNYEVSGSAKGRITITWDNSYVTLSKWFKEDLSKENLNPQSGNNSISFDVGGEGKPTSYLMQFYRLRGRSAGDELPYIDITFVPEASGASTS